MRVFACTVSAALAFCACATAQNTDDTSPADAGGGGKDGGGGGKDGSGSNDSGGGYDTGPGCEKCGGASCVDLKSDPMHCGMCSTTCTDQCCNGACADTTSDNANCGGCGMACMGNNTCCSSSCTDTKTDVNNCGGCGMACNGTCTNGTCMKTCTVDLGSCSHSPCVAGSALTDTCDPDGCTYLVCDFLDASCCSSSWSATCVSYAVNICGESCGGC